LLPAHPGSPGQRAIRWVCVCACVHSGYDDYDRYDRFGAGFGGRSERDGYGGRDRYGMGFGGRARGQHTVYMRGLPYSANEHDVLKVNLPVTEFVTVHSLHTHTAYKWIIATVSLASV